MTLATLQNLRTFTFDNHPTDLEEGQLAFNLAAENQDLAKKDANIYMYVGNASNVRIDEDGTVLVPTGGTPGKGWIRYRLRNVSIYGDDIYGDLTVVNSKLKLERSGAGTAELLIPTQLDTPTSGSGAASLRWNTDGSKLEAWNGSKWDTTAKVSVGTTAPANPSNGDMWFDPTAVAFYVYVVPVTGPAYWAEPSSGPETTALQPGNGVTSNAQNEIDTINSGSF